MYAWLCKCILGVGILFFCFSISSGGTMEDIKSDSTEEEINQTLRTSHFVTLEISTHESSVEKLWIFLRHTLSSKSLPDSYRGVSLKSWGFAFKLLFHKSNLEFVGQIMVWETSLEGYSTDKYWEMMLICCEIMHTALILCK